MKIIVGLFTFALALGLLACNNSKNEKPAKSESELLADSLKKEVDDDHIVGMSKMGRLTKAEQVARRLLDSIQKLPAKAKQATAPLQTKLDSLRKELEYAEFAMDKWMKEFKWDSTFKNVEDKIDYYRKEKLKVSKVKEYIVDGLEKADSVLKEKL